MCHLIAGLIDSTLSDDQVLPNQPLLHFIEFHRSDKPVLTGERMRSSAGVNFETTTIERIPFSLDPIGRVRFLTNRTHGGPRSLPDYGTV